MSKAKSHKKIQHLRPDELHPYPNNPRPDGAEISAIEKSLTEYGFNEPIICDSKLTVCSGHKRLKAAKNLGMATVPVIVNPDLDDPGKFLGYLIAANRTAELATWDEGLRTDILLELKGLDSLDDLTSVGWDMSALESFTASESDFGTDFSLNSDPKGDIITMSFALTTSQGKTVKNAIQAAHQRGDYNNSDNPNKNANALERICEAYCG